MLNKMISLLKDIIIDWRIGLTGFVGFTTCLIITKDIYFIIGIATTVTIIAVDIFDKNYTSWYNNHMMKKLKKTLANPQYQQNFFNTCSDEELKLLKHLYTAYPKGRTLTMENVVIQKLTKEFAIKQITPICIPEINDYGEPITKTTYVLQPWAATYIKEHKDLQYE